MKKKTVSIIFMVVVLLSIIAGVVIFLQTDRGEEEKPVIETKVVEEVTLVKPTKVHTPKPTVEEPEVTPEPTEAIEEVITEPTSEPTPEPEVIVEVTEEEMITGKYNEFNKVISDITLTGDYTDCDWVFHNHDVATITINKDGLKSSGSYKSYVTNTEWKKSDEYNSTFKYGENLWNYECANGNPSPSPEYPVLTKEITKFGFDFDRFKVKKSETSKDTTTITGTYTLSTDADTIYDMFAMDIFANKDTVGDVNKVTADVTITLDLNTKSMKKVVLDYNMNGEVFGTLSEEGELDVFIDSYIHTFEFE